MESYIQNYLEDLESELMFGKCAGKNANLSKLHQNKVQDKNQRVLNFERLRRCLFYHPLGPNPDGYKTNISDIEEEFIETPNLHGYLDSGEDWDPWTYERDPIMYTWKHTESYFESQAKDKEHIDEILTIYEQFEFIDKWKNAIEGELIFENIDLQFKEQTIEWNELVGACDSIFAKLNQIDEIWPFLESKSAKVSSKNSDRIACNFTKDHLEYGMVDRIHCTTNSQKTYIFGGPGYGKTIFMQQITGELTNRELSKESKNGFIPIFVKAKYVSEGIIKFCELPWAITSHGDYVGEPDNDLVNLYKEDYIHYGLSLNPEENGLEEAANILKYAMIKTLPNLDQTTVNNLFYPDFKENWNEGNDFFSKIVLFVDAYDECLEHTEGNNVRKNRLDLLSLFVNDVLEMSLKNVIITCRPSHRKEITEFSELIGVGFDNGSSVWDLPLYQILDMKFTSNELRFEMPRKLANAWGLNSSNLDWKMQQHYDNYAKVLSHPLFVGLFCLMINEDDYELGDLVSSLPKCEYDEYGPHHVKFIQSVINYGINISIESRYPELGKSSLSNIRKAFLLLAAINHLTGNDNIDYLWKSIESNTIYPDADITRMDWRFKLNLVPLIVTAEEKDIVMNDLGVVYLSDGNELTWTHKTISEVATGIWLFEEGQSRKNSELSLECSLNVLWSINRYFEWSECLMLTLGLLCSDVEDCTDYRFPLMKSSIVMSHDKVGAIRWLGWAEKTLSMVLFYQQVYSIRHFNIEKGRIEADILFDNNTAEYELADMYLEYLNLQIQNPKRDGIVDDNNRDIADRFVRIPIACYKAFSEEFQNIPTAIEVLNWVEIRVGRFPAIFPGSELNLWPPLILNEQNFGAIHIPLLEVMQPPGMLKVDPIWTLIYRHYMQVLISQPANIDIEYQTNILISKLNELFSDLKHNTSFYDIRVIGGGTGTGFKSKILKHVIGIWRNYGNNDELLELICQYYANQMFPNQGMLLQISQKYRTWVDKVSREGLLSEMFNKSEIQVIKEAVMINNPYLDIIAVYRVYCNPNVTMRESFVGDDEIVQMIRENGNWKLGVFYRD